MNKGTTIPLRTGVSATLLCALLLAPINEARAGACPSIDFWLELIREGGGQHRQLNAVELSRGIEIFETLADSPRYPWTSGIMTVFPDGSGWVLLNVNTSVCGVIKVPPSDWPVL
jgi:hypothetical protein